MDSDISQQEQEALAFLREGFLQLLSRFCAQKRHCQVSMYDNTNVECDVTASDSNFHNIIVENLVTPIPPVIPKAILRTSDIISMRFKDNDDWPDRKNLTLE